MEGCEEVNLSREQACQELREALIEREQAESNRRKIVSQYIYSGPVAEGQPIPKPPKEITIDAVKEMLEVEERYKKAGNKWQKALNRYRNIVLERN